MILSVSTVISSGLSTTPSIRKEKSGQIALQAADGYISLYKSLAQASFFIQGWLASKKTFDSYKPVIELRQFSRASLARVYRYAQAISLAYPGIYGQHRDSRYEKSAAFAQKYATLLIKNISYEDILNDLMLADYLDIPELIHALSYILAQELTKQGFLAHDFLPASKLWQQIDSFLDDHIQKIITNYIRMQHRAYFERYVLISSLAMYSGASFNLDPLETSTQPPVAFSIDGQLSAIVHGRSNVVVFDMLTNNALFMLSHGGPLLSIRFSYDSQKIVTTSWDKTARVWDARNGQLLMTLTGHTDWVTSAEFSFDNTKIVTTSNDTTAKVWSADTGRLLSTLAGHKAPVRCASFCPDSTQILTGSTDKTAKIWVASTGELLRTIAGHESPVIQAMMSADKKKIITVSLSRKARVWSAQDDSFMQNITKSGGKTITASFGISSSFIVTRDADKRSRSWAFVQAPATTTLAESLLVVYRGKMAGSLGSKISSSAFTEQLLKQSSLPFQQFMKKVYGLTKKE